MSAGYDPVLGDVTVEDVESGLIEAPVDLLGDVKKEIRPTLRFSWRPEDEAALEHIRSVTSEVVSSIFTQVLSLIDEFYLRMRVPRVDAQGMVVRDSEQRVVWECGENGNPKESWDQLTGQDVEELITSLLRLRMELSWKVNELFLDAAYARRVASDMFDESWVGVKGGTQGDRNAHAGVGSREDRYHSYFRYCLYSSAKSLLDEVNHLVKHLENIRFWRIRSARD